MCNWIILHGKIKMWYLLPQVYYLFGLLQLLCTANFDSVGMDAWFLRVICHEKTLGEENKKIAEHCLNKHNTFNSKIDFM